MANIMFFPHPEYGHLNPPLRLGRALKRAGHRVYYIGLEDFRDYICSQGLEYISIFQERFPSGFLRSRIKEKIAQDLDNLSLILAEATGRSGAPWQAVLGDIEVQFAKILSRAFPDLLIIDFKLRDLTASLLARFRIPTAILSVTLIDLRPTVWMKSRQKQQGEGAFDEELAGRIPELFICPKEFDFPFVARENRHYIEPCVELERKEPYAFPSYELRDNRPLIYCSLGSQPYQYPKSEALFRTVIEAMAARPQWQLVVAVGTHLDVKQFQDVPENVLVVNWAPQLKMLARAKMMITHGGLGTVKECILFAVPMIVFPCRWDQPHNAARVAYHGLGLRADIHQLSATGLGQLMDTIAGDPSFQRRVETMSKVFRESENSGIGVKTIEKILEDHRRGLSSCLANRSA
jgi:UDP:flavonoid glycosyltransferase YjiC (YdhE family)